MKISFASYNLVIFWKLGQFPRTVGHDLVVLFLHCSLPHVCIFGSQRFVQIKRSSNNATLVRSSPCWGGMWFFYHVLDKCRSFLRYLPSLPNLLRQLSYFVRILIVPSLAVEWSPIGLRIAFIIIWIWFGKFIHNYRCRAFILPIWMPMLMSSFMKITSLLFMFIFILNTLTWNP